MTRDFSELPQAIEECPSSALKKEIGLILKTHYDGDITKPITNYGTAAQAFHQQGGAIQWEFPFSVDILKALGMIKEVTPINYISANDLTNIVITNDLAQD